MVYETFLEMVRSFFEEVIPEPKQVSIQTVYKNNGVKLDGLVIMEGGANVSPTLYLYRYYMMLSEGKALESVLEDILDDYHKYKVGASIDTSFYTDFSKVSDKIVFKLINLKRNKELLQNVPHIIYLDLAVVFYYIYDMYTNVGNATILIHNSHMDCWKVSLEELNQIAQKNAWKLLPPELLDMDDVLRMMKIETDIPDNLIKERMFVLTNSRLLFGAACILYDGFIRTFAEKMNSDILILPSSVHETILLPASDMDAFEQFSEMVREINQTEVDDEDVLSDHAYYYVYSRDKIIM